MPLYEYQCDACGHRFEIIHQKFSDPPAATCPSCGGTVQKLQSAPAIQFKGAGFYITDYAKKDQSTAAREDAKEDAKESASKDGEKASAEKSEKATETVKSPSSSESTASTAVTTKDTKDTTGAKDTKETKSKTV